MRIIKNEFLKRGDKVSALKFHSLEYEVYWLDLRQNTPFNHIDFLIVGFNRLTSKQGTDPIRAFAVFLLGSLIMYVIFLFVLGLSFDLNELKNWHTWAKYFSEFINPLNRNFQPYNIEPEASLIFLWFFRFISTTLFYQFIQAFRKFGRI
jgi:hypothetical protein